MSFEDLKARIKAKGKPTSPEGWKRLLGVFTPEEVATLIKTQRLVLEARLSDNYEEAVELAMRYVIGTLDYSPEEAANFIRLGKDLVSRSPPRPDVMARMGAYYDERGIPFISQTRH